MTGLSGRLHKLEERILSKRIVDFGEVYKAALKKLCRSDQELVTEVMAHRANSHDGPHQAAWVRLDAALMEAGAALHAPVMVTACDLLL